MHIQSYLKPVYAKNLCSYWTHVIIRYGVLFSFPAFSIGSIFLLVFMSITSDKLVTEKHCLKCKPSVLGFVFVGFFSNLVKLRPLGSWWMHVRVFTLLPGGPRLSLVQVLLVFLSPAAFCISSFNCDTLDQIYQTNAQTHKQSKERNAFMWGKSLRCNLCLGNLFHWSTIRSY